ncbi:MAG: hypothetical protein IIA44_03235 [Acidobacteria bacterium]|nr:hypothetical protein [Acidobacteriota bacterium]
MKARLQSLAAVLGLVLIVSCGDELVTEPGGEDMAVAENVVIVDTLTGAHLESISGTTYTFRLTDSTFGFAPGDIIVGREGTGFLREVTSTTPGENELTVETTDASLTDAIIGGGFCWASRVPVESNPGGEGWQSFQPIAVADGIAIGTNGIDLSGFKLFSGSVNGTNLEIVITNGLVTFTPSVDLALEIQDQQLSEFHAIAGGPLKFTCDLTMTADGPFTLSGEMHLATFEHVAVQRLESVPVVEVVTLRFDAGFEATAADGGYVMCGMAGNYDLLFGGRLADEGWYSIWNPVIRLNARPTYWENSADMHVRVFVRPTIEIAFYGVAGPSLSATAYMDFDGEVVPAETWEWTLSGGLEGAMDIKLGIIDPNLVNHAATFGGAKQTVAVDNGRMIDTWEKHIGGAGDDQAEAIVATSDGGFLIAGSTDSYGAGGHDMILIKTDALGEPLWQKTYGGAGEDLGHAVVVTSDGH